MTRVCALPCCLLLLFLGSVCLGQSKKQPDGKGVDAPSLHLGIAETITVPTELASTYAMPFPCDSDGNFYVMTSFDGESGIRKLNRKGELVALFRASTATDPAIENASYFSVATDGEVYQLAFPHMLKRYVVVFSKEGTLKSEVGMDTHFGWVPSHVTPFTTGDFLASGLKYNPKGNDLPKLPFTGIFSSSGALLKEITLADDKKIADMAASGDERVVEPGRPLINTAVQHGAMEAASDGNIYLMRRLSPAILYAISPGGAVVKRFTVDPGKAHFLPFTMHIAGRKIAILFREGQTREQFMKVVDLDGHDIATYLDTVTNGPSSLGLAFACFTDNPERFTFLGTTTDDKLQFKIAEPR